MVKSEIFLLLVLPAVNAGRPETGDRRDENAVVSGENGKEGRDLK